MAVPAAVWAAVKVAAVAYTGYAAYKMGRAAGRSRKVKSVAKMCMLARNTPGIVNLKKRYQIGKWDIRYAMAHTFMTWAFGAAEDLTEALNQHTTAFFEFNAAYSRGNFGAGRKTPPGTSERYRR
jgi:hypothetical protein|tara:strand:+ start:18143 stop:18517 length:375 start_codon:yes stop_codon:yes gene_type:complete